MVGVLAETRLTLFVAYIYMGKNRVFCPATADTLHNGDIL